MSTISLSLPNSQIEKVDELTDRYGFANRSEFFRSLLRFITQKPEIISQAATYPMISPKVDTISQIVSDFKHSEKYSKEFLKDLEDGLKDSRYFNS